ncbi:MAG: hypothetical protein LBD82_04950 [Deltaproteobacteria bacterium]|jgi:hypothetical protein|nr:hypothetical protein [Deltaproteobacteria bacterium]
MDIVSAAQADASGAMAAQVIKDSTGAQLVAKTLDKLNAGPGVAGGQPNQDYQFQKDVLNAAGIGRQLDTEV